MFLIIAFEVFSLRHLPILDFRPYKVGVNITEGMTYPEDAKQPVYETILVYEKDGIEKEFTVENYPQDDSWQWVRTDNKLIEKGYEPPIHNFSIMTDDGDFTDIILGKDDYVFLLVSHDLNKSSRINQDKINEIADLMQSYSYDFICLTSTGKDAIDEFVTETGSGYQFAFTDQTTLKTIVRSNPGLLLIKKGTILDKWHHRQLPDAGDLADKLNSGDY